VDTTDTTSSSQAIHLKTSESLSSGQTEAASFVDTTKLKTNLFDTTDITSISQAMHL